MAAPAQLVDLFANSDVYVKLYTDDVKMYLEIITDSDQHIYRIGLVLPNFRLVQNLATKTSDWQMQHNLISLSTALPSTDYYALLHRAEALSDAFVWRLSVAYIGPNSRTERPRKTKIGTGSQCQWRH